MASRWHLLPVSRTERGNTDRPCPQKGEKKPHTSYADICWKWMAGLTQTWDGPDYSGYTEGWRWKYLPYLFLLPNLTKSSTSNMECVKSLSVQFSEKEKKRQHSRNSSSEASNRTWNHDSRFLASDRSNARGSARHAAITFCVIVEGTGPCGHLSSAHVDLKHTGRVSSEGTLGVFCCLRAAFTMFSGSRKACTLGEVRSSCSARFSVETCQRQKCDLMLVPCHYNISVAALFQACIEGKASPCFTFTWLLSWRITSGLIHSCSLDPSTQIFGLNQRCGAGQRLQP